MKKRNFIALLTSIVMLMTVLAPVSVYATEPEVETPVVQEEPAPADDVAEGNSEEPPASQPASVEFITDVPVSEPVSDQAPAEQPSTPQEEPSKAEPAKEETAPASEPKNEDVSTNENIEPPVAPQEPSVPVEPAKNEPAGDVSKAFPDTDCKISSKPASSGSVELNDKMEMSVKFVSGQSLDKLKFQIVANKCVKITNISTSAFEGVGDVKFAIYKEFEVAYKDNDKEKTEKYLAPLGADLTPGEEHSVNTDAEFASFATDYEDPKATFTGNYYITFASALKNSISGEITVKGKVIDIAEGEHAGIRISPIYSDKDAKDSKDWRAKVKFAEPKEEPVEEPKSEPQETSDEGKTEEPVAEEGKKDNDADTNEQIDIVPSEDPQMQKRGAVKSAPLTKSGNDEGDLEGGEIEGNILGDLVGGLEEDGDGDDDDDDDLEGDDLIPYEPIEGSVTVNFAITVLDENSDPIEGATVAIMKYGGSDDIGFYTEISGETNEFGVYEVAGLPWAVIPQYGTFRAKVTNAENKYDLTAGTASYEGSIELEDEETNPATYSGTATLVLSLKEESGTTGDDAPFDAEFYATVSDSDGTPVSGVALTIGVKNGEESYSVVGNMTTDAAGEASFTLENATANEYLIKVDETGWEGVENYNVTSAFELGDVDADTPVMYAELTLLTEEEAVNSCKIIINAIDNEDESGIQGATYTLTADGAEDGVELVTDENGVAEIEKLAPGTYVIEETSIPDEYDALCNPVTVTLKSGTREQTFRHNKKGEEPTTGKIVVHAIDMDDDSDIAGVTYRLTVDGDPIEEKTTGEDGIVEFEELEFGDYVVEEVEIPEGYDGLVDPQDVELNKSAYTLTFQHRKEGTPATTGKIVAHAVDVDDESDIAGVTYRLSVDGETVEEKTTGEDGIAEFADLEYGNYTVEEVEIPEGYDGLNDPQSVELTKSAYTITFQHHKAGSQTNACKIIVQALCNDNSAGIEGAKYTITAEGAEDGQVIETNENGIAESDELEPGTYTIAEIYIPEEYDGLAEPATVTLTSGPYTIRCRHNLKNPGGEDKGILKISVLNSETDDPVAGAIVAITSGEDVVADDIATGEDGIAVYEGLAFGDYKVAVTAVPAGFEIDETSAANITLSAASMAVELTVAPIPVEDEELAITAFNALEFNPDTVESVVGNPFEMTLDGYSLELNKDDAHAAQILFHFQGFTADMHFRMAFAGQATGYSIQTVNMDPDSSTSLQYTNIVLEGDSSADAPLMDVSFNSEESSIVFPENARFLKVYIYNPTADFAVTDFAIFGRTPDIFHDPDDQELTGKNAATFTVRTDVTLNGTTVDARENNSGSLIIADPEVELTLTSSVPENETVKTGETVTYDLGLVNTSETQYLNARIDFIMSEGFEPTVLNVGKIENYEGRILVQTVDEEDKVTLVTQTSPNTTVDLSDAQGTHFRVLLMDPLTGVESIDGMQLKGRYSESGTQETIAEFKGSLTEYPDDEELIDKSWTVGIPVQVEVIEEEPEDPPVESVETEITFIDTEEDPIPGLVFSIYAETAADMQYDVKRTFQTDSGEYVFYGKKVSTITTDSAGNYTGDLDVGSYMIQIDSVPEGIVMPDPNCETFTHSAEDPYIRTIMLEREDSGDEPGDEPGDDPGDNPGGGGGYRPPTGEDGGDEPTDEPVELAVDTPNIYANTNTIAYGDDAVFNIRSIDAVGLESDNYYVLHIMIPEGVQVRSISFPGFGSSVKVSLAYQSGSTELGNYVSGDSVALSERQGSNLRYISFQMRGVTEVKPDGEITLMLKNISARDRVATLQAILSVRDAKTAVREQHYDKYNIALAGPKTSTGTNTTTSDVGSTTTTDGTWDTTSDATVTTARANNLSRPFILLMSADGLVTDILIEPKVDYVSTEMNMYNTYPLLLPEDQNASKPTAYDTGSTFSIGPSPVTNDTIRAFVHMMNRKHLLRENFALQKSPALMTKILRANQQK